MAAGRSKTKGVSQGGRTLSVRPKEQDGPAKDGGAGKRVQNAKAKVNVTEALRQGPYKREAAREPGHSRAPSGRPKRVRIKGKGLVDDDWRPPAAPPELANRRFKIKRKYEMKKEKKTSVVVPGTGNAGDLEVEDLEAEELPEGDKAGDGTEMCKEIPLQEDVPLESTTTAPNNLWMQMDLEDDLILNDEEKQNKCCIQGGKECRRFFRWLLVTLPREIYAREREKFLNWEPVYKWRVKKGYVIYGMEPRVDMHRHEYENLMLREADVGVMYKVFQEMDEDNSGEISLKELMKYLEIPITNFTKSIFEIFDEDKSGQIDFREFVIAMWNYCTLTKATLILFAFDMYDKDRSGELTFNEVEAMLKDVYGKNHRDNFLASLIVKELNRITAADDPRADGSKINIQQFYEFCKGHDGLLYPAFTLQQRLVEKVGGAKLWDRNARNRIELADGNFVNVGKLLGVHVKQSSFKAYQRLEKGQEVTMLAQALQRTGILQMRRYFRGFLIPPRDFEREEAGIREATKAARVLKAAKRNPALQAMLRRLREKGNDVEVEEKDPTDISVERRIRFGEGQRSRAPMMRDSYAGLERPGGRIAAGMSTFRQTISRAGIRNRMRSRAGSRGKSPGR